MSQLTTHILDTTTGRPATDVPVSLYRNLNDTWEEIAKGSTNNNGRISDLLPDDAVLPPGTYKLKFFTGEYFHALGHATFYPYVEIVFKIDTREHYHVPLLLNPFGYTTYRGS